MTESMSLMFWFSEVTAGFSALPPSSACDVAAALLDVIAIVASTAVGCRVDRCCMAIHGGERSELPHVPDERLPPFPLVIVEVRRGLWLPLWRSRFARGDSVRPGACGELERGRERFPAPLAAAPSIGHELIPFEVWTTKMKHLRLSMLSGLSQQMTPLWVSMSLCVCTYHLHARICLPHTYLNGCMASTAFGPGSDCDCPLLRAVSMLW